MKAVVQHVKFPPKRRIVVISDIHGKLGHLKALLSKVGFHQSDILILLGDLVEKGTDSLRTLRYIMALSKTHTVYTLCGNCDHLAVDFSDGTGGIEGAFYPHYLGVWQERSLLIQMGLEAGIRIRSPDDLPALQTAIREQFRPEVEFLRALPTILETPDMVFVHGGVPSFDHMEELEAWSCMKNDAFLEQGWSFPKYCVVGHWPVTLYLKRIPDCDPLVNRERKIISIDGGCGVKEEGQLNALLIPQTGSEEFTWARYDGFPLRTAVDSQQASQDPCTIRWVDNAVELLERGEEFTLCRHKNSGRTLFVLTDRIRERDGRAYCEDATDYRLEVAAGDRLSVVEETSRGYLCKKGGIIGWYLGRLQPE